MTKNPIEMANKLIASKNPQLVKMGEGMLAKYKKSKDSFITTTKNPEAQKLVYDENGNVIGQRMTKKPIGKIKNEFIDDRTIGNDRENEYLKKFTKRVPRTRSAIAQKRVECYICGKVETVNPIHAAGKFYRCVECAKKITRI